MASGHGAHGAGEEAIGHISPISTMVGVWAALMILTILTVLAIRIDLGSFNIVIAMGIATIKAALVATYFMHLRWDEGFYSVAFLTALVTVFLFLGFALLDTSEYQPDIAARIAAGAGG